MNETQNHLTLPEIGTVGAFLASVRESKGIPIEQASHETRVRLARLREIENDDFSRFGHPSYARMFLMDYAKYLGVPIAEIKSALPDRGEVGAAGYQYIENAIIGDIATTPPPRERPRRRLTPVLVSTFVIALLAIGAVNLWITLRNLDRLGFWSPTVEESVPAIDKLVESFEVVSDEVSVFEAVSSIVATGIVAAPRPSPTAEPVLFVGGALDSTQSVR